MISSFVAEDGIRYYNDSQTRDSWYWNEHGCEHRYTRNHPDVGKFFSIGKGKKAVKVTSVQLKAGYPRTYHVRFLGSRKWQTVDAHRLNPPTREAEEEIAHYIIEQADGIGLCALALASLEDEDL